MRKKDVSEIWALVQRFQDTDLNYFLGSLRKHKEVVRFRAVGTGELVGFVAIDVIHHRLKPKKMATILFTSNVVIDPRFRRQNLIQRAGVQTYARALIRYPGRPVFWLFDSFSYKSYLLMGRNFKTYWPHPRQETPGDVRRFLDEVATSYYGDAWDGERGIVRRSSRKKLKEGVAPIGEKELTDPLIRHFLKLNPDHQDGDMLLCLAPLNWRNWSAIAQRALKRSGKMAHA